MPKSSRAYPPPINTRPSALAQLGRDLLANIGINARRSRRQADFAFGADQQGSRYLDSANFAALANRDHFSYQDALIAAAALNGNDRTKKQFARLLEGQQLAPEGEPGDYFETATPDEQLEILTIDRRDARAEQLVLDAAAAVGSRPLFDGPDLLPLIPLEYQSFVVPHITVEDQPLDAALQGTRSTLPSSDQLKLDVYLDYQVAMIIAAELECKRLYGWLVADEDGKVDYLPRTELDSEIAWDTQRLERALAKVAFDAERWRQAAPRDEVKANRSAFERQRGELQNVVIKTYMQLDVAARQNHLLIGAIKDDDLHALYAESVDQHVIYLGTDAVAQMIGDDFHAGPVEGALPLLRRTTRLTPIVDHDLEKARAEIDDDLKRDIARNELEPGRPVPAELRRWWGRGEEQQTTPVFKDFLRSRGIFANKRADVIAAVAVTAFFMGPLFGAGLIGTGLVSGVTLGVSSLIAYKDRQHAVLAVEMSRRLWDRVGPPLGRLAKRLHLDRFTTNWRADRQIENKGPEKQPTPQRDAGPDQSQQPTPPPVPLPQAKVQQLSRLSPGTLKYLQTIGEQCHFQIDGRRTHGRKIKGPDLLTNPTFKSAGRGDKYAMLGAELVSEVINDGQSDETIARGVHALHELVSGTGKPESLDALNQMVAGKTFPGWTPAAIREAIEHDHVTGVQVEPAVFQPSSEQSLA